jgi:hypothetical protein
MNFFGGIDPLICQTKLQRSTRIQCSVHNCPDQRKSRDDESLAHGGDFGARIPTAQESPLLARAGVTLPPTRDQSTLRDTEARWAARARVKARCV